MIISLIIPVYNVELYVEKCLLSCVNQNLSPSDYEIIVINDGTKDNSLAIVERLAQEYTNIKIVSQSNAGLSAARNKGLSLAQGEYVWFIDSDDWIEANCLKEITTTCSDNKLDILAFSAANVINNLPKRRFTHKDYEGNLFKGKDFLLKGLHAFCVPFSIYKRSYLIERNISFYVGIFHEDIEFTPRAYYHAEKVMYIDYIFYFVYQNPNSITRSINPKKSYDLIKVCRSLATFARSIEESYKTVLYNNIALCINNSLFNAFLMDKEEKRKLNNAWEDNKDLLSYLRKSSVKKYKIEGLLFFLTPFRKYVEIYQFLQKFNKKIR